MTVLESLHALIVADARVIHTELFAREYTARALPRAGVGGSCLWWTASAIIAAQRHGIRLVPQAGSAMFRRLPDHLDDGKPDTLTHFSYVWTPPNDDVHRSPVYVDVDGHEHPTPPHYTTRPDRVTGRPTLCLPEMHVWAGDPVSQTLVDLSTFDIEYQCETVLGQPWLDEKPPPYLWCTASGIPSGWHYEPNMVATLLAVRIIMEST